MHNTNSLKITNPNDLKSVIASSEGVDSSSEQEIQKLNIGTCLLTGLIDIPLKINVRPRVSKHGGETVTITMPYEKENPKKSFNDDDENNLEEKAEKEVAFEKSNKNLQFIEHFSCEISKEEAQKNSKKTLKSKLVPAVLFSLEKKSGSSINLLVEKVGGEIVKEIFPKTSFFNSKKSFNINSNRKKYFRDVKKN